MPSQFRWLVLAVLSCALLLIVIDMTVLYLALPHIVQDLGASANEKLWIVNAYALSVAGLLPGMGALGERQGYKRIFLSGLAVFGIASIVAAFALNSTVLIFARVALAFGAAMMMPATLAIVRTMFTDPNEQGIAIGIWAAVASGGATLGPIVGGVLLEHFWWGSVFLINVPIVLIAFILTCILVPHRTSNRLRPFDFLGALLIFVALVAFGLAIKLVAKPGTELGTVVFAGVVSVAFGILFFRRQYDSKAPLIDFALFRNRTFSLGVATALIATAILLGMEFAISQRLQLVVGLSPLQAGLAILPIPVASFISGVLTGSFLNRVGSEKILWCSLAISAVGIFALLLSYEHGVLGSLLAFTVFGLGIGAAMTASVAAITLNAPENKVGMAASIQEVSFELGGALGIAILGSTLSGVYSSSFRLPFQTGLLEQARDSIDGAIDAASGLPASKASQILNEAAGAFDTAFIAVSVVAFALCAVAATALAVFARKAAA